MVRQRPSARVRLGEWESGAGGAAYVSVNNAIGRAADQDRTGGYTQANRPVQHQGPSVGDDIGRATARLYVYVAANDIAAGFVDDRAVLLAKVELEVDWQDDAAVGPVEVQARPEGIIGDPDISGAAPAAERKTVVDPDRPAVINEAAGERVRAFERERAEAVL